MLENKQFSTQSGYMALVFTIIISLILLGLTVTVSLVGYFTRFSSLDAEYKRVSLGLAESCVNVALLRVGQQYIAYNPVNEKVNVGAEFCNIESVAYATSGVSGQYLATIQVHACYPGSLVNPGQCTNGAFSRIHTTATVRDPNVMHTVPTTIIPTILVPAGVNASAFTMQIDGSVVQSGVAWAVIPGVAHLVSVVGSPPGLTSSGWAGACTGTANSGSITPATGTNNACYIQYTSIPTTARITLVANIIPYGPVPILQLKNNTTSNFQVVSSGVPVDVPSGAMYTATVAVPAGYEASVWGGACNSNGVTGTLHAGQDYSCVINFILPNTACADTVVMLDRTGNISGENRTSEAVAVKSLLDLYASITPRPKVGVGSMGGLYGNTSAQVPNGTGSQAESGLLTNTYGEGNSTASLSENYPTIAVTPGIWTNPNNALLNETPTPLYATNATNGHTQSYKNFGFNFASLPVNSNITGMEVGVSGKVSTSAQNSTNIIYPNAVGSFNPPTQWSTQSGSTGSANKVAAVSDGSDTTYITTNVSGSSQTFKVGVSSVPSGANITSVTISARSARAGSGTPALSLRLEKGMGATNQVDYAMGSVVNTAYSTFSTGALPSNPFSGNAWTLEDIGSLGFGVLKSNTSGNLRVAQIYVTVNYSYTPEPLGSLKLSLSWDGGVSWSISKIVNLNSTEIKYKAGGSEDTWGTHIWTFQELENEKLMLRLTNSSTTGQMVHVNYLTLKIYYSSQGTGLYGAISAMMASESSVGSDIAAQIHAGNTELNSIRHSADTPKVLIIVNSGAPTKPTGNLNTDKNLATTSANTAKSSGTQIFTVHFGDSSGASFLSTLSSGSGYFFDASTAAAMQGIFHTIGAKVCPATASASQTIFNVVTHVINSNGGLATAPDFTITVTGAGANPVSFPGSAVGTSVVLVPDSTFSLSLTGPVGYSSPQYVNCPGSVSLGDTIYCTVILYDQPPPPSNPPPPSLPQNIDIRSWVES